MKRRLLAGLAAVVLAAVGGITLLSYVSHADARAMAGMETVDVLVVKATIPAGTTAAQLPKLVGLETLPAKAVVMGTVSNLDSLAGLVTATDLNPGEQLFASRFVDPAASKAATAVKVPPGMQQLSISMERSRMLGSALTPGATVGVFVSMAKEGDQPSVTHLVLHRVLVTQVGEPGATPAATGADAEPAKPTDPGASVLVTFAVKARDAEKLVFGAEHGRLWLSLEPKEAITSGTQVVNSGNVFTQ